MRARVLAVTALLFSWSCDEGPKKAVLDESCATACLDRAYAADSTVDVGAAGTYCAGECTKGATPKSLCQLKADGIVKACDAECAPMSASGGYDGCLDACGTKLFGSKYPSCRTLPG
jgi:hypothetical protein